MKQHDEIRALFKKAGLGQDGTDVHLSFETEEEADEAFAYLCELGISDLTDHGVYAPRNGNKPKLLCRLIGHRWKPSHRKDEIRDQSVWVYLDDVCTRCWMTEWRMP